MKVTPCVSRALMLLLFWLVYVALSRREGFSRLGGLLQFFYLLSLEALCVRPKGCDVDVYFGARLPVIPACPVVAFCAGLHLLWRGFLAEE